jgi:hypothetical protein
MIYGLNDPIIPNGTIVSIDKAAGLAIPVAEIVGISQNAQPILGRGYIVKQLTGSLPTPAYPYTTLTVFEKDITILESAKGCLQYE